MKFIDHGAGGPASVLKIAESAKPVLKTGEVLIEVQYAGVNRPDILQRSGKYPPPPGASPVLGLEVAGEIVEVASDVTQWKPGDVVCALTPGGGYAEYCVAPALHCLPVPKGLTVEQAASLPENWFTVWTNIIDRGRLKSGETFLVHGGSSGIGLAAIQLAKARGATVYTTVGNTMKAEVCRTMGADEVWNYKDEDWAAGLWKATEKRGVDLILDMVGGEYVEKNIRSLALEGRLVQIAFLQPSKVSIDCMPIMIKRLTFTGSTLRPRTIAEKAAIAQDLLEQAWPRFESGELRTYLYRTFFYSEASAAHELMESSTHIGKIVLAVRGG
ncbi:MAG: NAD(P)H-quinone oxidoreductase [Burkholderiales bacterium]